MESNLDTAPKVVASQVADTNLKRPREDNLAGSGDEPDRPTKRSRDINNDDEDEQDHEIDEEADASGDEKPSAMNGASGDGVRKLSKNQQRKLRRQMYRQERKHKQKLERREKRREKSAARQEERFKQAAELAAATATDVAEALRLIKRQEAEQKAKPYKPEPVPIAIIIDCDFEKYMHENELVSLSGQITRSYSMNRSGRYISHLLVSSWGGKLKERFETTLRNTHKHWRGTKFVEGDFVQAGIVAWGIMTGPKGGRLCPALGDKSAERQPINDHFAGQQMKEPNPSGSQASGQASRVNATDQTEVDQNEAQEAPKATTTTLEAKPEAPSFSHDSIIYLSSDSPNVLDKLEPNTSYVIGGLVDRNREKGLCQCRAEEKGIRTAKLPIGKYLKMSSRQVLATTHVVEIISKWLETGDWGEAFMAVIPKRKGGQLKYDLEENYAKENAAAEGDAPGKNVAKPGVIKETEEAGMGEPQLEGTSAKAEAGPQ